MKKQIHILMSQENSTENSPFFVFGDLEEVLEPINSNSLKLEWSHRDVIFEFSKLPLFHLW